MMMWQMLVKVIQHIFHWNILMFEWHLSCHNLIILVFILVLLCSCCFAIYLLHEIMFPPVSFCLCLLTASLTATDQIFIKFYGIIVHSLGTNLLVFELP